MSRLANLLRRLRRLAPGLRSRLWIVTCDHSIAVVRSTKREAIEAAKLRAEQASKPITHFVVGPYRLDGDATVTEVS